MIATVTTAEPVSELAARERANGELRALLARIATSADNAALGELYDRVARSLYAHALWRLGGAVEDAEDALSAAFVRIARSAPARVESPMAWLYAVVRNESIRLIERRASGPTLVALDSAAEPTAAVDESPADAGGLAQLIDTLPPDQRDVVRLKFWDGLTLAEIAIATGVSANTAASRYRLALARLRERAPSTKELS
jgi:RNA polymerase sigma-70 factor (ECF subfamily)